MDTVNLQKVLVRKNCPTQCNCDNLVAFLYLFIYLKKIVKKLNFFLMYERLFKITYKSLKKKCFSKSCAIGEKCGINVIFGIALQIISKFQILGHKKFKSS